MDDRDESALTILVHCSDRVEENETTAEMKRISNRESALAVDSRLLIFDKACFSMM